MHDVAEIVQRLRRRAVDEGRRQLAEAVARAADAEHQARAAERCIEQEAERASDPDGDDAMVEAFASWLPGARQRAAQARTLVERHEAEVARCRAELTASRTALAAVDGSIAARAATRTLLERRTEQRTLDEAAARRSCPGPNGAADGP